MFLYWSELTCLKRYASSLFFFLASTVLLCCEGNGPDQEDDDPLPEETSYTFKVMTYNIWGARTGGITNLQEIADVIKRINPDLVALQEVDVFTQRNGKHVHIARDLAQLCGMEYFFAKAMDYGGGAYGDAVLSRLPIREVKAYRLGVTAGLGGEPRSVARVTVEIGGKEIYFISTHFDHLNDEANRIHQAREFVSIIKDYDKPTIVGADFNALPGSETIAILREQLVLGCRNNNCSQFTFSTTNPNRVIDYVMYNDIVQLNVSLYEVYGWATKESDHFPVIGTFKFKPNS